MANRMQLLQVLQNSCAMPWHRCDVTSIRIEVADETEFWAIRVADKRTGNRKEEREKIFELVQAPSPGKDARP
jgi:light-regulated signal transduction histidine kinase (bacteriophytochrome)